MNIRFSYCITCSGNVYGSFGQALWCFSTFLGRNNHNHTLAFETWHLFGLAKIQQGFGKLEQLLLALLLVDDAATLEKDIDAHFVAVFEESAGMVELEFEVVVVNLRAESNFFDHHLGCVGLALFLLFFQFVEILLVLYDFTNRRVCGGRNHNEIQSFVVCQFDGIFRVVDGGFHPLAYHTYNWGCDALVYLMFRLFLYGSATTESALVAWFEWCCYNLVLLC